MKRFTILFFGLALVCGLAVGQPVNPVPIEHWDLTFQTSTGDVTGMLWGSHVYTHTLFGVDNYTTTYQLMIDVVGGMLQP